MIKKNGDRPHFPLLMLLALAGCASPPPVACTMEAKACPDGSYVGRDAARNCEFRPCPGS